MTPGEEQNTSIICPLVWAATHFKSFVYYRISSLLGLLALLTVWFLCNIRI
jgi:hypothetical protein